MPKTAFFAETKFNGTVLLKGMHAWTSNNQKIIK